MTAEIVIKLDLLKQLTPQIVGEVMDWEDNNLDANLYDSVFASLLNDPEARNIAQGKVGLRLVTDDASQVVIHTDTFNRLGENIQQGIFAENTRLHTDPTVFLDWGEKNITDPAMRYRIWERAVVYYLFYPDHPQFSIQSLKTQFHTPDFIEDNPRSLLAIIREGIEVGVIEQYLESRTPIEEKSGVTLH